MPKFNLRHRTIALLLLAQGLCAHPAVAEDADLGRLLASQCAQCHGTASNPYPGFERLAGKTFEDIYDNLEGRLFENEALDLMTHQAQGYTAEQLAQIASYLASLPSP